jgi:hypothetical protein
MILGAVQSDDTVALLNAGLIVDAQFMERATEIGRPEKRFRFAGKCIKGGCRQWTGHECGVIKEYSEVNDHLVADELPLPACIIREKCRWFGQEGGKACMICPYVVTDNLE